jgi:hypothetical protein
MHSTPPIDRIPWRSIAVFLAGAAIIAWSVGFLIGLVARFAFGA